MIKLDLLSQIAFGNQEYVQQLLEAAKEDLEAADEKLQNCDATNSKELFNELHRLKTTLSMLQAGPVIMDCQSLLDQIGQEDSTDMSDQLNTFRSRIKPLIQELDTLINKS